MSNKLLIALLFYLVILNNVFANNHHQNIQGDGDEEQKKQIEFNKKYHGKNTADKFRTFILSIPDQRLPDTEMTITLEGLTSQSEPELTISYGFVGYNNDFSCVSSEEQEETCTLPTQEIFTKAQDELEVKVYCEQDCEYQFQFHYKSESTSFSQKEVVTPKEPEVKVSQKKITPPTIIPEKEILPPKKAIVEPSIPAVEPLKKKQQVFVPEEEVIVPSKHTPKEIKPKTDQVLLPEIKPKIVVDDVVPEIKPTPQVVSPQKTHASSLEEPDKFAVPASEKTHHKIVPTEKVDEIQPQAKQVPSALPYAAQKVVDKLPPTKQQQVSKFSQDGEPVATLKPASSQIIPEAEVVKEPKKKTIAETQQVIEPQKKEPIQPKEEIIPSKKKVIPIVPEKKPAVIEEVLPPKKAVLPPQKDVLPPKVDVLPPKEEVIPPKQEVLPPKKELVPQKVVLPKKEVVAPKKEVVPPKKEVIPPKKEIVPPKKEVVPPKKEVLPPKKEIIPPKKEFVPPKKEFVPQQQKKVIIDADIVPKPQIPPKKAAKQLPPEEEVIIPTVPKKQIPQQFEKVLPAEKQKKVVVDKRSPQQTKKDIQLDKIPAEEEEQQVFYEEEEIPSDQEEEIYYEEQEQEEKEQQLQLDEEYVKEEDQDQQFQEEEQEDQQHQEEEEEQQYQQQEEEEQKLEEEEEVQPQEEEEVEKTYEKEVKKEEKPEKKHYKKKTTKISQQQEEEDQQQNNEEEEEEQQQQSTFSDIDSYKAYADKYQKGKKTYNQYKDKSKKASQLNVPYYSSKYNPYEKATKGAKSLIQENQPKEDIVQLQKSSPSEIEEQSDYFFAGVIGLLVLLFVLGYLYQKNKKNKFDGQAIFAAIKGKFEMSNKNKNDIYNENVQFEEP